MPRIRIVPLDDGRVQVAILPNKTSEQPARMATVSNRQEVKGAINTLMQEWDTARQNLAAKRA